MAFKMKGFSAFTKKTEEIKADMPEVTVTPKMEKKRKLKKFGKNLKKLAKFSVEYSPIGLGVKALKGDFKKNKKK